ncbi:endogenous retrovirus group 3 member 1 Env polyprotein-like [Crotalus tigris]|uniref:endogenous retrovirus group 3 member 1 Env polyprotein-like n=1 Tax=Crotalus tigris TaxID=88082 RepID=UPI00192F5042|nr:endogenous retrovirus group 3 member 1 Env polyprotein-like [Crotalus tigris]
MLKNSFVCGGTNMGDEWPWHAREANYTEIEKWRGNFTYQDTYNETWRMSINLVGNICYSRSNHSGRTKPMGFMRCLNTWENNTWISQTNQSVPNNSLSLILELAFLKDPENDTLPWTTPDGLYWICGAFAYNILPAGWFGSCILGAIQPSFFLLPLQRRQLLGVPAYEHVGNLVKRSVAKVGEGLKIGSWKDDEWPPERIIAYYDPATWAQDGSWGYRTPIYMLNRIIRLQAVVEIITNRTAAALTKLAKESVLSRTYIMQNQLALDYLLAKEGGVCGKFNLTNCCIQIDDSGMVINQITRDMVRIAHVPVQTWTQILDDEGFLGGIFKNWKQALFMVCIIFIGIMMLPCPIPVIKNLVNSSVHGILQAQQNAKSIMVLKEIGDQIQLLESMDTLHPMKTTKEETIRLNEIKENIKQMTK